MTKALTLFLILTSFCFAQDERFYRHIFTGELTKKAPDAFIPKLIVRTPVMLQDLNRDGIEEGIVVSKRDGQDWVHFLTGDGKIIFEAKLPAKAQDSQLYKIQIKELSKETDVMLLYFYEGAHKTANFFASARLYFVTIDNRELSSMRLAKGPYFFVEKERKDIEYWRRFFQISVFDFNKDGSREVSVSYNGIQRIYEYQPKNGWSLF